MSTTKNAVEKLDSLIQSLTEAVLDFYRRLEKYARDFGGVFYKASLWNACSRKLTPIFSQCSEQYANFAEHAASVSESHAAIAAK